MSKKKTPAPTIRSSAAKYLTFIAASGSGGVEAIYADESIWLSQKMMGVLYDVETHTINYHLKKVFSDNELQEEAVIRNFRITAADGKTFDAQYLMTDSTWVRTVKSNPLPASPFAGGGAIRSLPLSRGGLGWGSLHPNAPQRKPARSHHHA